jgi:hypothetical protein
MPLLTLSKAIPKEKRLHSRGVGGIGEVEIARPSN